MDKQETKLYLPVIESIKYGWHTYWENLLFFAGITFVFVLIELLVPAIIKNLVDAILGIPNTDNMLYSVPTNTSVPAVLAALVLDLIDIAVIVFATIYFTRIALLVVEGQVPSLQQILNYPIVKVSLRLLGAAILLYLTLLAVPAILIVISAAVSHTSAGASAIVALGGLIWIFAAFYFAIKYILVTYPIIDRNEKVFKAFKLSAAMTHKTKWRLIGLALLLLLINTIGVLCLLVGILVTLPVSSLAVAYAYRKLISQVEGGQTTTPQPKPTTNQVTQPQPASV